MSWLVAVLIAAAAAPAQKPQKKAPPAAQKPAPAPPAPSLDFDLLGDAPAAKAVPNAALVEAQIGRRRTMLQIHQALGLATWVGLAATEVVGQLNFNDKYRAGGDTGRYQTLHLGLAAGTTALFATVGLLGVFAPTPFEKHFQWDTATVHKAFMAAATAGMLTEAVLGVFTHGRDGHLDQPGYATAHQIVGYATLGCMTAGAVTLLF